MASIIQLGLVQMSMSNSAAANRDKAAAMVRQAAKRGAEIVCLPELFTSPYFCIDEHAAFDYAELVPGETSNFLAALARDAKVVLVGGSFHEKAGDKYYNTSLIFDTKGEQLVKYRKTHIPHDEGFYEQNYFSPGDTGYQVIEAGKAKLSVMICYDQWFPEAARTNALLGADIVFYPTAIGTLADIPETDGDWQAAWENVQRGHAIANNMIVAAVNRCGVEGGTTFWGGSFVCDAFGTTLARAGGSEEILVQAVDLEHSSRVREGWRFFYNRRPDTYRPITG